MKTEDRDERERGRDRHAACILMCLRVSVREDAVVSRTVTVNLMAGKGTCCWNCVDGTFSA